MALQSGQQSQPLLPIEAFNDDDFYVIDTTTSELIRVVGSKQAQPVARPGKVVLRGMLAKGLPLWRHEADTAMLRILGSAL